MNSINMLKKVITVPLYPKYLRNIALTKPEEIKMNRKNALNISKKDSLMYIISLFIHDIIDDIKFQIYFCLNL